MQETHVQSLGREDPLEKEMITHPSIFAWDFMDRGSLWATAHGVTELDTAQRLNNNSIVSRKRESHINAFLSQVLLEFQQLFKLIFDLHEICCLNVRNSLKNLWFLPHISNNYIYTLNINLLGISELKWIGMGEFNLDVH